MSDTLAGLPRQLAHLGWLLGTWEGDGFIEYPSIERARFRQRLEFANDGRPFLAYRSTTWILGADGEPVRPGASEAGYWRPAADNGVEVLLAHPTGYAEVWLGAVTVTAMEPGRVTGAKLELTTDVVARTETAKDYSGGQRLYGLVEGELLWTYDMVAVGQPLTNHLWARLHPAE